MTAGDVQAAVDAWLPRLKTALAIEDWAVEAVYGPTGCESPAKCEFELDYLRATITLDPDGFARPGEVAKALRHELLHLVVSPYELLYELAAAYLPNGSAERRGLRRLNTHACERVVRHLEVICNR